MSKRENTEAEIAKYVAHTEIAKKVITYSFTGIMGFFIGAEAEVINKAIDRPVHAACEKVVDNYKVPSREKSAVPKQNPGPDKPAPKEAECRPSFTARGLTQIYTFGTDRAPAAAVRVGSPAPCA